RAPGPRRRRSARRALARRACRGPGLGRYFFCAFRRFSARFNSAFSLRRSFDVRAPARSFDTQSVCAPALTPVRSAGGAVALAAFFTVRFFAFAAFSGFFAGLDAALAGAAFVTDLA